MLSQFRYSLKLVSVHDCVWPVVEHGWCGQKQVSSLNLAISCFNRPFLSSTQSVFQSESTCEIFVMVISSYFNMNENWYSQQRLRMKTHLEIETLVNSEMAYLFICTYWILLILSSINLAFGNFEMQLVFKKRLEKLFSIFLIPSVCIVIICTLWHVSIL